MDSMYQGVAAMSGRDVFYSYPQTQQHSVHPQQAAAMAAAAFGFPGGSVPFLAPSQPMTPMNYPTAQFVPMSNTMTPAMLHRSASSNVFNGESEMARTASLPGMAIGAGAAFAAPNSANPIDGVAQHLEKKEQMVEQLGSFLAQMKQESEGNAAAWKEKLIEIAELKRQLALANEQLAESQATEQKTAAELSQTVQDLHVAMEEVEMREKRHDEELTVMNNELTLRQSDADHMKVGYEATVKQLSQELLETREKHQEEVAQLNDALQKLRDGHEIAVKHMEDERADLQQTLEELNDRLLHMEAAKQELGLHLWNVSKQFEDSQKREQDLTAKLQDQSRSVEEARTAWTERFQQTQSDKAEQLGVQALLQSQLKELDAKLQEERAQKEELNAVVMRELQRFQLEMAQQQQDHAATVKKTEQDREHALAQLSERNKQLEDAQQQAAEALESQQRATAQLTQLQDENGFLQQNESEKSSTMQELNTELHSLMQQLGDSRAQCEHLQTQWATVERDILRAVQLLDADLKKRAESGALQVTVQSNDSDSDVVARLPEVVNWLDELLAIRSGTEQIKLTLLRTQQERDTDKEKFRAREQELATESHKLQNELNSTREDAKTLAMEIQQLSQVSGGNEAKLSTQISQLSKELDDARSSGAMQVMQLQRSLDGQRQRSQQLENEKKELLHEAEQLNASMETLFQTKNATQAELDHLRSTWKELQLAHVDLKETHEDLVESSQLTIEDLNNALRVMKTQHTDLRTNDDAQKKALDQLTTAHVALQGELEALHAKYESEKAVWTEKDLEVTSVLDEKHKRLADMMELLTQLQTQKDFLEQTRANDAKDMRQEVERMQQQTQTLLQDKKRLELALTSMKAQLDQHQVAFVKIQEDKRQSSEVCGEQEEQISTLRTELTRVQGELERTTRVKSALQLDVRRLTDDGQDITRQLEVSRRDLRLLEKTLDEEREKLHKELEEAKSEVTESAAQVEELQSKLGSIQKAANATINELMGELQNAQDSISLEKARLEKDSATAKSQLRLAQEELRRKDAELQDVSLARQHEQERNHEKEAEMAIKLLRLSSTLETKKQECEALVHEVEMKSSRLAEFERKVNPLVAAKDSLQTKVTELKQVVEAKSREMHDLEERHRDEIGRAVREKRELESMYVALKEDLEAARSQTSGHQNQLQTESKTLRAALERTRNELAKASAEVLSLAQRLETCQQAANETIADLTSQLHAAQQETQAISANLSNEREHRREAEVQKMELMRAMRQRSGDGSAGSTFGNDSTSIMSADDGGALSWGSNAAVGSSSRNSGLNAGSNISVRGPESPVTSGGVNGSNESFRKFYANEQLTSAELSSLPVAVIKAQIGLDMSGAGTSPAHHGGPRSVSKSNQLHQHSIRGILNKDRNNDEIPPLPLDTLSMYVE